MEGTVVVNTAARGDVLLFLFDAARPISPFTFSHVKAGEYLVRGFVDANADFIPLYSVTSEASAGDIGGAAVDHVTRSPITVKVEVSASGMPVTAVDVRVFFTDSLRMPVDRPAFEVTPPFATLGPTGTKLELSVKPLLGPLVVETAPIFLAQLVDANADGTPDDFWPWRASRSMVGVTRRRARHWMDTADRAREIFASPDRCRLGA